MQQSTIDNLIEKYKDYPGSVKFIFAVNECFKNRDSKFRKNFIETTFRNNSIKDCDWVTFKKLSAHWNNIAYDKLNMGDYESFYYSSLTTTNFRIISHFLENTKEVVHG